MKLFYSPGACSLASHIVALEAGLSLEIEAINLRSPERTMLSGKPFSSLNPKGYVPALQLDDGQVLSEGIAIMLYLAGKNPDAKLVPAINSMDYLRQIEWLVFVSSEIHKGFGPLWNPASPEDFRKASTEKLLKRVDYIDQQLAGKSFLQGNSFSIADAYAFTVLNWSKPLKVDLSAYKNVQAYMERIASRPAVQAALKAEGLI